MSHQHKRRKLTREEKAKRNVKKGERRKQVARVREELQRAAETAERAKRLGLALPDNQDTRRYGRGTE